MEIDRNPDCEKNFVKAVYAAFQTRTFEFHHASRQVSRYSSGIHRRLIREGYIEVSKMVDSGRVRVWRLTKKGIALAQR